MMISSKISEKLLKIINKEITEIEVTIPFNEDNIDLDIGDKVNPDKTTEEENTVKYPVSKDGYIPVIIVFKDPKEMKSKEVKDILLRGKIKNVFSEIPAICADLTSEQILDMSEMSEVEIVEFDDYAVSTLDTARKWFGVDRAVQSFRVTGNEGDPKAFTARDNVIAILDTGIDINHVDLSCGKVIGWRDEITPGTTTPYDDNGHGTHVASIAAGLGRGICDYRGVAFGSALVGVKVLNAQGVGTTSQIISGILWCIANREAFGIRVINLGLSVTPSLILRLAVAAAVLSGIVVVCAAGNNGPARGTIGSPGDADPVITVGNMADVGQNGYFLVPSSSRGPVINGRIKPDIVAPGYNITAAKAGTTDQYVTLTGTSMASAFVAGVVALMLDRSSDLTPAEVKTIITRTAQPWGNMNPNNDYGYGRLQAFYAIEAASEYRHNKCEGHEKDGDLWWNELINKCSLKEDKCGIDDKCGKEDRYDKPCGLPCIWQPAHFTETRTIAEPANYDLYEFYIDKIGLPAAATLLIDSADVDLDLVITDANFESIAGSFTETRQETVEFIPDRFGKYHLFVLRLNGTSVRYQLDLSIFGYKFRYLESGVFVF